MPAFLHHKPQLAWSSCLLLSLLLSLSPVTPQDAPQPHLIKRQLPNQTGSTPIPSTLLDPAPINRSLDPTKTTPTTPTTPPADPAAPLSSPSPAPNSPPKDQSPSPNSSKDPSTSPTNPAKDPSLSDPLLPGLLGPPPASAPNSNPSPIPNTPNRPSSPPAPPSANSTAPSSTNTPPSTPPSSPTNNSTSPSRAQQPPTPDTNSVPQTSPVPSTPSDAQNNRATKSPTHKSDDTSSGFGSTTIKLMAIIAGSIAGLFLLWTVIRKWKFRPSKRFAKKLDEYDEDVFAPRPPSFREKRANDYQAYSIPPPSNTAGPAFGSQYPSYLPERCASPHSTFSPQKLPYGNDSHGSQAYQAHRLSHVSITQPPAMFEPNPYRLSLGLGNVTHAYPPSDQHPPTAL